jgi:hypothetical protein
MELIQCVDRAALTFDEERREVLESIGLVLTSHVPDSDEMAACGYLLRHLSVPHCAA